jgi:tetratricopeptide (TPR) repeat protein
MALGQALTIASALLLPPERCEFLVRGIPEPQSSILRFVDLYRKGDLRDSDLSRFSAAEREAFVQRVRKVREMRYQGITLTREPEDPCIQSVSLIETEIAMRASEQSRWQEADARFEAAWNTSFWIEDPKLQAAFQRSWLLVAGLLHHELIFVNVAEEAFTRADRFLDNAVRRYPDDAEILLAAGALLEWSGSLRWGVASHLKEAEELYARARRLAPEEPAILIRHGIVLEKLGSKDKAVVPLLRILELGAREDILYRSRMVLGKISEAAGQFPDAIAHYQAASMAIPSWQVAYVALGHALHSSGSHQRARAVLDRALAMDMKSADEVLMGWWSYELGLALRFEPLIDRLRAEVRR